MSPSPLKTVMLVSMLIFNFQTFDNEGLTKSVMVADKMTQKGGLIGPQFPLACVDRQTDKTVIRGLKALFFVC